MAQNRNTRTLQGRDSGSEEVSHRRRSSKKNLQQVEDSEEQTVVYTEETEDGYATLSFRNKVRHNLYYLANVTSWAWDKTTNIIKQAFEKTYNNTGHRVILKDYPYTSAASAFMGTQTKYVIRNGKEHRAKDLNYYNWFEFCFLFPLRVPKNILKLGTEFLPNLLYLAFDELADFLLKGYESINNTATKDSKKPRYSALAKILGGLKRIGYRIAAALFFILGLVSTLASGVSWLATKLLQSITSPFASMKQSFNHFNQLAEADGKKKRVKDSEGKQVYDKEGRAQFKTVYPKGTFIKRWSYKTLGFLLAACRGLIAVGTYAAIAVFAAPGALSFIAGSGSVGSTLVAGLSAAASWVGSLPVVSAVGSTVAAGLATLGSSLGLSTGAAAAATAASVIVVTPVLAATKVFVRWLFREEPQLTLVVSPQSTRTSRDDLSSTTLIQEATTRTRDHDGQGMSPDIEGVSDAPRYSPFSTSSSSHQNSLKPIDLDLDSVRTRKRDRSSSATHSSSTSSSATHSSSTSSSSPTSSSSSHSRATFHQLPQPGSLTTSTEPTTKSTVQPTK